ncbi:DNA polymerase III subunit gamma/tau [Denitratisoma oestradiolicum]|uniref:DNA polymerase III subunit gamma/tau n=1 Tax=Denitratisoma oestradiolicum TaxID=311182 RepID=A0A6S6XW75_9PROT|nr:DNA polymerase III subunit gamma/tau [Denitratisoma oestradiolicum]TWO81307.1 DNA polymerase III subunit gamma/tau [Denitratisoma oestradiolicum]CAB1368493.1 DNA polymerase III subunit gamma/tau [Denitratisoma oestradiolicum]
MSYQVLARKWRPKSFATLVGQEHVVRALTHALDQQRLHHAYLFTGTRGVGKTTLARIMAKALNCEAGVTSTPCGVCSSCMEIDGGRFVDLIEVDAATNTKVDEMRQLLENATYAPTRGRYKVYVIDEVHMLSNSAFNAMLKTLEEPPEHIKFILATTDPQKIPVTVLSRCLQFNLKQMPQGHIVDHLSRILEAEGVVCEALALRHLAKAAAGSMRDALSLLDQAIAHGAGKVEEEGVRDMLGTVGDDYLYALLDALAAGDAAALVAVADRMEARSLAFDSALQELATLLHRIALLQFSPEAMADPMERARLQVYADALDPEFLQLCYQIVIHGRDDLALAPDEYAGFTMTLLRLTAFRPEAANAVPRQPATAAPANKIVAPVPAQPVAATTAPAPKVESRPVMEGDDPWHQLVARLPLSGMARQLAQHCELVAMNEALVTLRLSPVHKHLMGRMQEDKLQTELQNHFGRPLKLALDLADTESETPAEKARNVQRERQERAIAAIEGDNFVREVVDMFDATIDESTIKPI